MLDNNSQRILLKLLLGDENQAAYQWNKWVDESNWLEKPIDSDSLLLLPIVYQRLPKDSIVLKELPRLKGVYRRAWIENSRLFHQARLVFSVLRDVGIPVMLVDRAALSLTTDLDRAALPITKVDFAVPESKINDALRLMLDLGWRYQKRGSPLSKKAKCFHAFELVNPEGGRIRVYRYLRPENQKQGDDLPMWKRAVLIDVDGHEVFAPSPADAFLLTLLNGWRSQIGPSVSWIWDTHIFLMGKSSSVDWDLVAIEAQRRQVSLPILSALNYLRNSWNFSIPPKIMTLLSQVYPTKLEVREEKFLKSTSPFMIEFIRRALSFYLRKKGNPNSLGWWPGFIKYLFCLINPPTGLKVLPWIFGRISKKIFV